jgi:two-component system NtrC family sensor kinase
MAEVATGVLHNVGNVLNSVNVSSTLVCDGVRQSKLPTLVRTAAVLREHAHDLTSFFSRDPRGRILPELLTQLAEHLSHEQTHALKELESLTKNIAHIKDIVAMQQSYAKVSGVAESLPLAGLVEDALQFNIAAFTRHGVSVVRQYEQVPPVTVDRHKVLQILINLMHNAKYAMDEAQQEDKLLVLGIARNGEDRVRITVGDNGMGISSENLTRIFSHGFTTKRNGHGFGLHIGALAAREMGGSLTAHSDGPGRGATFTLELPLANEHS